MIRILSRINPSVRDFLTHMREDLNNHRVRLVFGRTRMVRFSNDLLTAGFFQEPSERKWGIIKVGTGNRKPITILTNLAHEYCHFLQWKSGDNQWHKADGNIIDGGSYLKLEEKTEKEAIRLLRDWRIPANYNAVRMRSNAYLSYLRSTEIDT